MAEITEPKIGIVVPTLGTRSNFLKQTLKSIRLAGTCYITVVSPEESALAPLVEANLFDQWVQDPMQGLAKAINTGIKSMPVTVQYFNWLGDDDTLTPNSLAYSSRVLDENLNCVCVFGKCQYVNKSGEPIWMNKSGRFAVPLLRFGPQLIPQPGSLFRRQAFNAVGGLDTNYNLAFDLDLLIKLSKVGTIRYIPVHLSSFRWHSDSLSVRSRQLSVFEAKKIRQLALPKKIRLISQLWEIPLSKLIYLGGMTLTKLNTIKRRH